METVVVAELMWQEGLHLLRQAGLRTCYEPRLFRAPARLRRRLRGAAALIVRNGTRVDAALLEAAPGLRVVGRLGAGLDNVDVAACRRLGVEVVYAPEANGVAVAEMTMGLMLALARRIPAADRHVRRGGWNRAAHAGIELEGRTLGILGFGRVGRLVADRARAFGMEIAVAHPRLRPDDPALKAREARLLDLPALLAASDVLSVHLPLTPETAGLIGAAELALMKPTAFLVNTGRGGVVDEEALAAALSAGRLGGAALDVRAAEPPGRRGAAGILARLPNVILTPHVAGLTHEAQRRTAVTVASDVLRVLRGEPPRYPAPRVPAPPSPGAPGAPSPAADAARGG